MKIENVINGKSTKRFLVRSVYAAREHTPPPATGTLYINIYIYVYNMRTYTDVYPRDLYITTSI